MSTEIERLEAEIAQRDARITELEKFADEANAQMLEAFAERDHALKAKQPSAGVVMPDADDWSVFFGYLIDKCEGHPVYEESLQGWLADMIADPHYGALFRREKTADGKPVNHSLPIAMAIEAAEEEHGGLRAAAQALGIDSGYLSRLKSGEKLNPSNDVLSTLGLERVTMYRAAAPSSQQKESGDE